MRDVDIREISDGHFYELDDMVRVGCGDCRGCSDCCRNTGDTIILDPFDFYRLCLGTGKTFTEMIEKEIEIRLVDGLILPNLMEHAEDQPEKEDGCPFLGQDGRCSIHAFRPGFCRMFPLGRVYDGSGAFRYILQAGECSRKEWKEVKVRDWIDTPDPETNAVFIRNWHAFCRRAGEAAERFDGQKQYAMQNYILHVFFVQPYTYPEADRNDPAFWTEQQNAFIRQYDRRMQTVKAALHSAGIRI